MGDPARASRCHTPLLAARTTSAHLGGEDSRRGEEPSRQFWKLLETFLTLMGARRVETGALAPGRLVAANGRASAATTHASHRSSSATQSSRVRDPRGKEKERAAAPSPASARRPSRALRDTRARKRRAGGRTERTPTPRRCFRVRPSPTRSPAARPRASPRGASSREASPRGASHQGRPRRDIARTRTSRRPRRRPRRRARAPGLLPRQRSRSYWTKSTTASSSAREPRRRRGSVPTSSRPASLPVGPSRERRTTRRATGAPGARGGTS